MQVAPALGRWKSSKGTTMAVRYGSRQGVLPTYCYWPANVKELQQRIPHPQIRWDYLLLSWIKRGLKYIELLDGVLGVHWTALWESRHRWQRHATRNTTTILRPSMWQYGSITSGCAPIQCEGEYCQAWPLARTKQYSIKKLCYSCSCVSMHDPMPRPPSVAFLRTCVEPPHENKKLSQMMKYLRVSIGMPLTLEASCLAIMELWVNGSYAGHPDMLNHTGGTMSLGLSVLKCWSRLAGICPIQSTIIKSLIAPLGVCRTSPMVRMTKMHIETIETTQ